MKNLDLKNFKRELKLRKLLNEQEKAEFTKEFPLGEIRAMSEDAIKEEIHKIEMIKRGGI